MVGKESILVEKTKKMMWMFGSGNFGSKLDIFVMANFDSNCVFRVLDQNRPFLLGLKMAEFEARVRCVL